MSVVRAAAPTGDAGGGRRIAGPNAADLGRG